MNAHRLRPIIALAVLLAGSETAGIAHAYRPFNGTDGDVAETGEFEFEVGPVHYLREGGEAFLLAPTTVLNLGILPRTELIADITNVVPLHPHAGPGYQLVDTDLFMKVLLRRGVLQHEGGPSLALEGGPLLPELHGASGFGAALNLIVSEQWGWFAAHLNNAASLSRGDLRFGWSTSLIMEARVDGPVRPVTELLWDREFSSGASTYSMLGGAIWTATEGFDLDAALVVGSVDKTFALEVRVGLTWVVSLWEPANRG